MSPCAPVDSRWGTFKLQMLCCAQLPWGRKPLLPCCASLPCFGAESHHEAWLCPAAFLPSLFVCPKKSSPKADIILVGWFFRWLVVVRKVDFGIASTSQTNQAVSYDTLELSNSSKMLEAWHGYSVNIDRSCISVALFTYIYIYIYIVCVCSVEVQSGVGKWSCATWTIHCEHAVVVRLLAATPPAGLEVMFFTLLHLIYMERCTHVCILMYAYICFFSAKTYEFIQVHFRGMGLWGLGGTVYTAL